MPDPKKRSPTEMNDAIHELALDDELERIAKASDADLDADVRALGGDPDGIRARGAAFVALQIARVERRAKFEADAADRLARALTAADKAPKTPALPRGELLRRIEAATKRGSLAQPIAIAFKKRKREAASDEELRSFLDRIAELEAIADVEGQGSERPPRKA